MWSSRLQSSENRKRYIDDMYHRITPDDDDKKRSRTYVDQTLNQLISHVRNQDDGNIYGHQIVKAGSYPISAKIGKADEFDTNIFLNIDPKNVFTVGTVTLNYAEVSFNQNAMSANLQTDTVLERTAYGETVPNGYAVVEVDIHDAPPHFQHAYSQPMTQAYFGYMRQPSCASLINAGSRPEYIHIIPRDVKQDLHQKIKTAKSALNLSAISISNASHGPALTLTITPDKRTGIVHKISVDVTVSLKCPLLTFKGWPRQNTLKAFDKSLIDAAFEAGIHLVPKKDLFWAISYSRAERAILSSIDKGFGCRKRVLKLLKKYMAMCQSKSTSKLPGMSSHVLKTQVLWSCERHADDDCYWNHENRDVCLINTMLELADSLRQASLQDYFNTSVDILRSKSPNVLAELVDFMNRQATNLRQMV